MGGRISLHIAFTGLLGFLHRTSASGIAFTCLALLPSVLRFLSLVTSWSRGFRPRALGYASFRLFLGKASFHPQLHLRPVPIPCVMRCIIKQGYGWWRMGRENGKGEVVARSSSRSQKKCRFVARQASRSQVEG